MSGPRAAVIGTGLIGGSLGLALRQRGWHVTGCDLDEQRAARALAPGALEAVGRGRSAELPFGPTRGGAGGAGAIRAVVAGGIVTDLAGVKTAIVSAVGHPRFVGGHPMAGSEQEGVEGAYGG